MTLKPNQPFHAADQELRVCFVGTYPPRQCGIATFTYDLLHAVRGAGSEINASVIAVSNKETDYRYPSEVAFEIKQNRLEDYRRAADFLNSSGTHIVCLQHEFGIFGGLAGRYIKTFLERVRCPVLTTLHTIIFEPPTRLKTALAAVAKVSQHLVILNERARPILQDVYDIADEKISMIHHGVPDVPFIEDKLYKPGVEGHPVILTFGLLHRNKGIELTLEALPEIVRAHPETVYLVVGMTHPQVQRWEGESYRHFLMDRVHQLGLEKHVVFHNRYVDFDELCAFIGACDIYVTPYRAEEQIVSGTLAYAVGMGKAVVSTPYRYAQELLSEGRGRLIDFDDARGLAEVLNDLIVDNTARRQMRYRAYEYGRSMIWRHVGRQYVELLKRLCSENM